MLHFLFKLEELYNRQKKLYHYSMKNKDYIEIEALEVKNHQELLNLQ